MHLTIHSVPGAATILLGAHLLAGCVSRHPANIHMYKVLTCPHSSFVVYKLYVTVGQYMCPQKHCMYFCGR